jgi:hypothetical protein
MTQKEALLALVILALAAGVISKRYLPRDLRMLVAAVGLVSSSATLLGARS